MRRLERGGEDARRLVLVESVAETVWGTVQAQFARWQESVWALSGLVVLGIVLLSWNVVVLLTDSWGLSLGLGLLLVVVVVGRCWGSWTVLLDWT